MKIFVLDPKKIVKTLDAWFFEEPTEYFGHDDCCKEEYEKDFKNY